MPAPIPLQLYTLREAMAENFDGVVRKVAHMGYVGVEPAGFPGTTPEAGARLSRELGLKVPSVHTPLPIGEKKQEVLDTMEALGSRRIVSGLGPDNYKTTDQIKASCDTFNEASAVAVEHGMTFGIHNHWNPLATLLFDLGHTFACRDLLSRPVQQRCGRLRKGRSG